MLLKSFKFIVQESPISQMRPRIKLIGDRELIYDPCAKDKLRVMRNLKSQLAEICKDYDIQEADYFHVELRFHFPVPASASRKQRNSRLWGLEKYTSKPDLDNLEKFYLDCMNGMIYSDDALVTNLSSSKYYSFTPRTEIFIMSHKHVERSYLGILNMFGIEDIRNLVRLVDRLRSENTSTYSDDERLERMALILSELAESNYKLFSRICKEHPDYYKRASKE